MGRGARRPIARRFCWVLMAETVVRQPQIDQIDQSLMISIESPTSKFELGGSWARQSACASVQRSADPFHGSSVTPISAEAEDSRAAG